MGKIQGASVMEEIQGSGVVESDSPRTMGLQLGHHWTQRRTTMMMMMVQNQMPFLDDLLRQMLVRKLVLVKRPPAR